jgi:hypothetical protein
LKNRQIRAQKTVEALKRSSRDDVEGFTFQSALLMVTVTIGLLDAR